MEKKPKIWVIVVIAFILFGLIASCGENKNNTDGELVTGLCSHCHGAGVTKYGNECGWCNGTGFWAYYK